ncbi:MAG TPA: LLM class flavin-dependent oxidoreductase [Streptosporangiaceae bacterium]|jgi:alkanesulfonate monooxygenase SsuD/methylene tetrahydromethanopterin reductase-like flavin-dependent oxidoreductase (luciferase family)|nr:LLM class flavin-dependent oxidoreductase [Streptosporangiaceae bacterium]
MRIGVVFPQTELGGDVGAVRAYAQRAEELGFTHVLAYDHVVGADPAVHAGWDGPYDVHTTFHEPMVLLRRLWTEQTVTFSGTFDRITGAGLAPLPVQRPIPVWIGGGSPRAYRRAGRLADGWFPLMDPGPQLDEARRIVAEAAAQAGRDPVSLGMEGRVRWQQDRDKLAVAMRQWQDADATHLSVNTMGAGLQTVDDHLAALATAAEAAQTISG